jgi:AraC-like DNA-binding protein
VIRCAPLPARLPTPSARPSRIPTRDWPVGRTTLAGDHLRHGILVAPVASVFQKLAVGASLWLDDGWLSLHDRPGLMSFEMEHGALDGRWKYNTLCLDRARRTGATVLGEHNGLLDFFVPVVGKPVRAVVVSGPFAEARPTSAELLERWRALTGRQGHPSDPEFSNYLSESLSTLVLDAKRQARFRRILECLAALMVSAGPVGRLVAEVASLTRELDDVRFVERGWDMARDMVDERTSRVWSRPHRRDRRQTVGLLALPDQVVVGLFVSRRRRDADPVGEVLRKDAFQRACAELARDAGDALSGRIGSHGVMFLWAAREPAPRAQRGLLALAEKAAALARSRHGLDLHVGVSALALPLPAQYRAALAAAESALSRGLHLTHAQGVEPAANPLRALRRDLVRLVQESPSSLPVRFDGYLAAVAAHCGYEQEPCHAHLEAAVERITEALVASGALESKGADALHRSVERAADAANTVHELLDAYRRAALDVARAVAEPVASRHDRSLRRALEFLRQHYAERLTLKQVARVAGFAPNYFSELFHKRQGVTFASRLLTLRLERARELLAGTSLPLSRVAQLSGLVRPQHLIRVLKRRTGETPTQYRRKWKAPRP